MQLVRLWTSLEALQGEINSKALPLAQYCGVTSEDGELIEALERCAAAINGHFQRYKIQAVKKDETKIAPE